MRQPRVQQAGAAPARPWVMATRWGAMVVIVALALAAVSWLTPLRTVLSRRGSYHPWLLGWNYDGTQELVVAALNGPGNCDGQHGKPRVHETLTGSFLCYDGAWRALPEDIMHGRIFADNGVIIIGPENPGEYPTSAFHLIKAGQISKLFTGQQLFDAIPKSIRQASPGSISLYDACYDGASGNITFCIAYKYSSNNPGVLQPQQQVDCIWDGRQVNYAPADVPHYSGHPYNSGTARLMQDGYEQHLQFTGSDGRPRSRVRVEAPNGIAGFVSGFVWVDYGGFAEKWDLQDWRAVEKRDLLEVARSIPRELFQHAEVIQCPCSSEWSEP